MMKKNRITIQQLQVRNTLYLAAITTCFLLLLAGCSTTRNLPEGEVLYTGQKKMVVRNEAKDRAGAETMTEL